MYTLKILLLFIALHPLNGHGQNAPLEQEELIPPIEENPLWQGCDTLPYGDRSNCTQSSFLEFVADNIRYPAICLEEGVYGVVYLSFLIQADGSIADIRLLRGVHPALDAEAKRILELMPKWVPGKQRGKPVDVRYNVPIKFSPQ